MISSHDSESNTPIAIRVDPPSATIILRRPDRGNALTRVMITQLAQALDDLHQEKGVRSVILTGAGTAFCTGTDLAEIQETQRQDEAHQQWFHDVNQVSELLKSLLRFPKPIIAAVNGPALGTGLALACACDMIIASPQATFGMPEVRRGLTSSLTLPLLTFRIAAGPTAALALRGESIDAEEAHRIGLVRQIVPHAQLWVQSTELATRISLGSADAIALTKRTLNETVGESVLTQLTSAAAAMATMRTTDDAVEGVDAFHQKRSARWR